MRDQRCDGGLSLCQTPCRQQPIDDVFLGKDRIDPSDRLHRRWRFADLREFEKLPPTVCPTPSLDDRPWVTVGVIETTKPGIRIRLQNTLPAGQMTIWMHGGAIRR